MLRLATLIVLTAALAFLGLAPITSAQAQGIAVTNQSAENNFPQGLLFHLAASSEATITDLRLRYQIQPIGVLTSAVPDFEPSTSVNVTFALAGKDAPDVYLPPGTVIDYFWELTDEAGGTLKTEAATVVYDDIRFSWQTEKSGIVNLHWYSGSGELTQELLAAAGQTLGDMSALLGAQVDFPVHIWVYASRDDMRPALRRVSESYESQVITLGVLESNNTVLMLGSAQALDTLRHELAHIVIGLAGEGPFGSLPFWLNEGTAVYAESDPGGYRAALEGAVERGQVFSLRSLSSRPGDPNAVELSYGQSWSVVFYLIDTYGPQKFAELFATFKVGATTDDALSQVYGFDQDGLEARWREGVGLPPQEVVPTLPPEVAPTLSPAGTGGQSRPGGGGVSPGLLVGLIAGSLALATVVGVGGYLISRRLS